MQADTNSDPGIFYRLHPDECRNFLPGQTRANELIVIGTHDRRLVGVFFQSSGELIRVEERAQPVEELSRLSVLDAELALWPHLEMWKAEIGFTPCAIRVKAFFLPELDIGIDTFPESEQAAIDAERPLVDPATGEPLHLDFSPHDNRHCFLFWWRKDYWMNAMGEVTDS